MIDCEIINYLIIGGYDIHSSILIEDNYIYMSRKICSICITNLLELSVYHNKIDVVKFLLECGMNPHLNDGYCIKLATDFDHIDIKLATNFDHIEIKKLLLTQ